MLHPLQSLRWIASICLCPLLIYAQSADMSSVIGGKFHFQKKQGCITPIQETHIRQKIAQNVAYLQTMGILPPENTYQKTTAPTFGWPLQQASHVTDYGYHAVSGHIDHDSAFGSLQDYNCGTLTYDNPGYNHSGIDYFSWPFGWLKMDNNDIEVIAAADGIIVGKDDGYFDEECVCSSTLWNAVYIRHGDGTYAWYGHLKRNSLTNKSVGSSVTRGEYLGVVGSSGCSSGPHLHFEVRTADNTSFIDPYQGTCNNTTSSSLWLNQRDYHDSGINKLMTHNDLPNFHNNNCPQRADTHAENNFCGGDLIYFAAYYRDQLSSQMTQYIVRRPDNSIWKSWTHNSSHAHAFASYWLFAQNLPTNPMMGIWKFQAVYEGNTYEHDFNVCFTAPTGVLVKAKVVLEGAYNNNGTMSSSLLDEGWLPLTQPYQTAPWNYSGNESVNNLASFPRNITDWVLVEVRDLNYNLLETKAALLQNDGNLLAIDGTEGILFSTLAASQSYYLSIRHRNHLAVAGANAVSLPNAIAYDFSNPANVIQGNNQLKEVSNGIYALHAGDTDANGVITLKDFNDYKDQLAQSDVYKAGDCTLDGDVLINDFNIYQPNASIIGVPLMRY